MSETEPAASLESISSATGNRLRVDFIRHKDRYGHHISLIREEQLFPLMTSSEGEAGQDFPPSPCLTQVSEHGEVLLLTGATSACFWSMSVSMGQISFGQALDEQALQLLMNRQGFSARNVQASSSGLAAFLSFEVACRMKHSSGTACSQYLLAEDTQIQFGSTENSRVAVVSRGLLDLNGCTILGGVISMEDQPITFKPEPECLIESSGDESLRIGPLDPKHESAPATIQWRYGFWVV